MLKLIGALCVIISTTMTGVMASALLKKRVNLLQGAISMIQTMCNELRFRQTPVEEMLLLLKADPVAGQLPFWESLSGPLNLCPLPQAFENWTQQPGSTGFEKEDIQVLCQVFSVLGTTDLEGQISTLKLQQQALAQHLEQAQGAYQKYSKLYRTLGLMSGVCIAILLL